MVRKHYFSMYLHMNSLFQMYICTAQSAKTRKKGLFRQEDALFATFFDIFSSEGSPKGTRSEEKMSTHLILAFEVILQTHFAR